MKNKKTEKTCTEKPKNKVNKNTKPQIWNSKKPKTMNEK